MNRFITPFLSLPVWLLAAASQPTIAQLPPEPAQQWPTPEAHVLTATGAIPPTIHCPDSIVITPEPGESSTVVTFAPTASDDSGLPPTIACVPASGSNFPFGITMVTCTATDGDGLSSACSFTVSVGVTGPVSERWVARYNNVISNVVFVELALVKDAKDNVIVAGYIDDGITGPDMLTIKLSGTDGAELWLQRYNGPANNDDIAQAVAVVRNGDVVVTGSSGEISYTAKYAPTDGALLWEKRDGAARKYSPYV